MTHEQSILLADALRVVTVVELGIVAGLSIVVFTLYLAGNVHIRRAEDAAGGHLIQHVLAISASYILLCAFAVAEIQGYYGTPLTYRAPIGFVAATFGVYALVHMVAFQNARLDRRDAIVHVGGTPNGKDEEEE